MNSLAIIFSVIFTYVILFTLQLSLKAETTMKMSKQLLIQHCCLCQSRKNKFWIKLWTKVINLCKLLLCFLVLIWKLEFFTLGVSVRLSDRFKVTQNKINFVKNCPQWDLNSQPPYHVIWTVSIKDSSQYLSYGADAYRTFGLWF